METLIVFTRKNLNNFIEEGGIGWWKISTQRVRQCAYVICTHNQPGSPQHGHPFFIGKITGTAQDAYPDEQGKYRYLITLSDYALLTSTDTHFRWPGQQNPITYKNSQNLDIPVDQLDWQPFTSTPNPIISDLLEIQNSQTLTETERHRLSLARIGQGSFRNQLLERWNHACPISLCTLPSVLRASHIQAWSDKNATNETRLDPNNGLLLAASIDALFDRHLISFCDNGDLLLSATVKNQTTNLGILNTNIGPLSPQQKNYMAMHRAIFFEKNTPTI